MVVPPELENLDAAHVTFAHSALFAAELVVIQLMFADGGRNLDFAPGHSVLYSHDHVRDLLAQRHAGFGVR